MKTYLEMCTEAVERRMEIIVGVCREDNPRDVDEAYGEGTYARLFPELEAEDDVERDRRG
jgi:hypothetical protein